MNHLEVLLRHAQERRYEFVYGRYVKESSPGVWQDGKEPRFPSGRPPFLCVLPHSSVLYRGYLQFKYDINAYRYNVGGDNLMWNRMARAGVRAGFLDRVVCSMPLRPGETALSLAAIQTGSARKWSVWIRT